MAVKADAVKAIDGC